MEFPAAPILVFQKREMDFALADFQKANDLGRQDYFNASVTLGWLRLS
ncbi:hypothetical protein NBG4_300003 [Candidatus Sulfobium mesophilum]|uniref:Uncharacterized protein n=1 Tax=Candidatus Sulfobium mesophilum TaxID=2016548 RepID=A0A2U3QH04_9BACT|nr:hypothetical protein NBG4_300003 [Candidatus Sulfobium mesophilum]